MLGGLVSLDTMAKPDELSLLCVHLLGGEQKLSLFFI